LKKWRDQVMYRRPSAWTLAASTEELQMPTIKTSQISTSQRKADGLVIRYAVSDAAGDETVLLLNPWPESLFAWETIWPRLAETARLVAIDLPGFGKSEGRPELFSPQAMGSFLLKLIDEWQLGHPHVVGPDVATGATLFAAVQDAVLFPSAVVGSGAASVPLEVSGALKELIEAPDTSQFQAVDGREIVAGALGGIERHTLPEAVREDYLSSYAGDRFVESMAYVRNYPNDLPILAERLGDIRTPVQIIAGRHDALVPPSNAEFLHDRLPESKLDILDTGHFTWEDGADQYLHLTRAWVESHPARRS
jgi:pimeloyl-ACP methyl ester carboxylesterase